MKKKQWVAPSVVASFLLGSVMTAHVLYENNLLPSFRGIASEEVITTTVEAPTEVREVTLEELNKEIEEKISEADETKKLLEESVELLKNEELTSSQVQEILDAKVSIAIKKINKYHEDYPVIKALHGYTDTNISFSEDVTDEMKMELSNKLSSAFNEAMNVIEGDSLYENKLNLRISKLRDKELEAKLAAQEAQLAEANARVEDLKTRVCEQTSKIDTLIEKVEKLVVPAQDITDYLNYSYGLMDTFSMQNSMMGMFMNPFMMYSPFSMSMMSPYSMFSNPFSMSMMNPYMMGSYGMGYPGMGLGGYGHTGYRGVSELADHERDYYGLANPTQKPRVNDSAFGVNYDDLRLGNDFAGNVDLNGGQTVMKIPQYSRSVANDVQTISVQ